MGCRKDEHLGGAAQISVWEIVTGKTPPVADVGVPCRGMRSEPPAVSGGNDTPLAVRVAREAARDAEWPPLDTPAVPDAQLWRGAWVAWSIILVGGLVIFAAPLAGVWWGFGGWAWPWVRVVLCGAVLIPCFFVALIWWLAISVSVGVKCPACGDVLHEQVVESASPAPEGRRRCGNCLAAAIAAKK